MQSLHVNYHTMCNNYLLNFYNVGVFHLLFSPPIIVREHSTASVLIISLLLKRCCRNNRLRFDAVIIGSAELNFTFYGPPSIFTFFSVFVTTRNFYVTTSASFVAWRTSETSEDHKLSVHCTSHAVADTGCH